MFKFIHAADMHLDSPLRGLEQYPGAPVEQIREATRQAFVNLVDLAVEEEVSFVLIAGDVYDGDWKDYNTGLFFISQLSRLGKEDIKVFVISGNHDAASRITKNLRFPENVHTFSNRKPETILIKELSVAIHGQGFSSPSVTENLAVSYPKKKKGLFNIGLLHTAIDGREGHEPYAPCKVIDMESKGYDYWALGHVHMREVICEDPWIVFPGNTQGRHVRELGAKGCMFVTVDDEGSVSIEHRNLDVFRWALCEVDVSEAGNGFDVVDLVGLEIEKEMEKAEGLPLAVRLKLTGMSQAHKDLAGNMARWESEIRAKATEGSGGDVWVEKIVLKTGMLLDVEELQRRDDALGGLLKSIRKMEEHDEEILSLIRDEFSNLKSKLPEELLRNQEVFGMDTPDALKELIGDVRQLLIPRLLSVGEDE